ncbi:MAG: HEAT repeat domain-containing protein [Cyanobacteria bacterium J06635_10]
MSLDTACISNGNALGALENHRVVRYSAVVALGEIQDLIATDALIDALKDEESVVEEVIKSLRLLRSSKVLPYVKKFLKSKNSKLRKEAVLIIGLLGDSKKDAATLYKFLKDKSFSVRLCSAYSLSQFGNRKGLPLLQEALETGNKDARKRALYGLENFGGKVGLTTIASVAVKDDEYSIRKEAIRFLKRFNHIQEVRDFLKRALEIKNENTARNAIEAVKVLGYPETLKSLRRIIKNILVVERPLEAMQAVQLYFGFYDFEIYKIAVQNKGRLNLLDSGGLSMNHLLSKIDQTIQQNDRKISTMASEPKNVLKNPTFNAPVNFGDNPTGDFITTQNNFKVDPEVQDTVSDLQTLVIQLQQQYPSVNAESEALTIIDAEFTEIKQSQNHKLATLRRQLLNPERHLQAGKATLVEVVKHFLEESVWAKAAITYFDKLSETPDYGT